MTGNMTLKWAWNVLILAIFYSQRLVESGGICGKRSIRKHWNDCQKFIECGENSTVVFQCPENSFFNPKTLVCDFAMYHECEADLDVDDALLNMQNLIEAPAGYLTATTVCNELHLGAKFQHSEHCNMFYHCSSFGPILFECPASLLFSSVINVCNWPQFVDCNGVGDGGDGGDGGGGDDDIDFSGEGICPANCIEDNRCPIDCDIDLRTTLLPHPSRCDVFLQCKNGCACSKRCEAGLYWSTTLRRCVERYRSDCEEIPRVDCPVHDCAPNELCPVVDDPDNPILLPHPERCDAYKQCHQGEACTVECADGLEYNPVTEVCDIPWGCVITTTPPLETTPVCYFIIFLVS